MVYFIGFLFAGANIITCVRIVFIPVFMFLSELTWSSLASSNSENAGMFAMAAFVMYALLSLTDKVDGDLARKRGEVTDFGKFLDPIADKLLVFSALLMLLEHQFVNVWFVFIILFREFLVSALRMVASANGEVIAADKLGKWKTATTMVSLCMYLLAIALTVSTADQGVSTIGLALLQTAHIAMIVAVGLTVVSGAQYFWNARHVIFRV